MKKHKKYRILGVIFLVLIVLSVSLISPTYAEDSIVAEDEEVTELTCLDLSEKYGLYIEAGEGTNKYDVIRDSTLACGDSTTSTIPLQLIAINDIPVTNGAKLEGANAKITVEASLLTSGNYEYMKVTFQNLNDVTEKIDVKYEIETLSSTSNTIGTEPNSNYNGLCATFRNEVAGLDVQAQAYYQEGISYCWTAVVPIGTNYTEAELQSKINRAKASWAAFTATSANVTTSFLEEFNRIKTNASKVSGHTFTGTSASATAPSVANLKCNYTYLPTNGSVYTNQYGDRINAEGDLIDAAGNVILSDGDTTYSYLNKDYYYGKNSYETGTVVYTYNYAPGKTKTVTQNNVCKKTCEESVKVEYGPPVASKAGLCFEYQVKVTSYVTCSSSFSADKPENPTNYCNPGPKCISPSGTVRKRPQAGPTADYETCIKECDGGKYTQSCSVKCYNEVYATSDDNEIKLALNYQTAQTERLAKSTSSTTTEGSYTLAQCKADNAGAYGCYYYDNGVIRWSSNSSYNGCSYTSSAGRWYIDNHYGTNLCGSPKYIVDGDGFVRRDYGGALCNDNCYWQTDCNGKYLNPGTMAKDYKANEEAYESARAECAGAASCTTKTATFTIAVKYDTEESAINKVYFPASSTKKNPTENANEYDSITKATLNINGATNDSIILSKDGCYTDKNVGNKYMTEWSFPGTYIHNKTGEISFKVPSDTSGWYYEDDKFCMPLNAKSVNTKWWEVYKVGNHCYTTAEVEAELAGTAGTSNGYNIEAITNDFGLFQWDFNVKCFYALKNEICNIKENGCCETTCTTPPCSTTIGTNNYMVRTIDRENIFPNAPVAGIVSDDTREIGFNWTEAASILELKNSAYKVNPVKLIEDIETNASQLYNDDSRYLDYQFYLTPSTLRTIRSYNNRYTYGEWNGKVVTKNGVNVYLSNFWNSTETSIEGNIDLKNISGAVIKTGDPGVNNE